METRLYYVSARTTDNDDCSLFVEATSPGDAQRFWIRWCVWNNFDWDPEGFSIFEMPALVGRSKTLEWSVDVRDVTP